MLDAEKVKNDCVNLIKNFLTFGEHISGQSQKNSV